MNHYSPFICVLLMSFALTDAYADDARSLDAIRWILGDWIQAGEPTTARETWNELHGEALKGMGITTDSNSGKKRSEESLLLAEMSGAVYYFAKVKQNKYPVPFELTSCSAKHAVFENTEHSFPKRLEYRVVTKDALNVIVSDGGTRSFTLQFKRNRTATRKEE